MSDKLYLTLTVLEGQNLAPKDSNGLSDPYCVLRLNTGGGSKKTKIIKKTLDPFWNETFDMGPIDETSMLKLTCWDHDVFSSDDFMGQFNVYLGQYSHFEKFSEKTKCVLESRPGKGDEVSGHIFLVINIEKRSLKGKSKSSNNFLKMRAFAGDKKSAQPITNSATQTFGVPLDDLMKRQLKTDPHCRIPLAFNDFIEEVTNRGVNEEGIFRIAGVHTQIAAIQKSYDVGEPLKLSTQSIHDVASGLKKFLRELPVPLLTYKVYDTLVADEGLELEGEEFVDLVKDLVLGLPPVNLACLRALLDLCVKITRNFDVTKMSTSNLVICLGPALLWDEAESIYTNIGALNRLGVVISTIMTQYDYIFKFQGKEVSSSNHNRLKKSVGDELADEAARLFITYDTNGDGTMDRDEFSVFYRDIVKQQGDKEPTEEEIDATIAILDEDKNNVIDLDEFTTWWRKVNMGRHQFQRTVTFTGASPVRLQKSSTLSDVLPPRPPVRRGTRGQPIPLASSHSLPNQSSSFSESTLCISQDSVHRSPRGPPQRAPSAGAVVRPPPRPTPPRGRPNQTPGPQISPRNEVSPSQISPRADPIPLPVHSISGSGVNVSPRTAQTGVMPPGVRKVTVRTPDQAMLRTNSGNLVQPQNKNTPREGPPPRLPPR